MPRCTRAICIPATIKMGSETPAERIVNASNFERNGDGLLAIRLWRDYVIATLSIDGGIVFCFALASKLQQVICGASARFSILCFEIGLGIRFGTGGRAWRSGYVRSAAFLCNDRAGRALLREAPQAGRFGYQQDLFSHGRGRPCVTQPSHASRCFRD